MADVRRLIVVYLIMIVISAILGVLFGATLFASIDSEVMTAMVYDVRQHARRR